MPNTKAFKPTASEPAEEPEAKKNVPASKGATPPGVDTETLVMEISQNVAEKMYYDGEEV